MKTAFAIAAIAGLTAAASATDYFGTGGSIPDNGGPSNPFSSSVNVGTGGTISDVNVTLTGASHTWVGDLIITLSHGATSVQLINRPGVPELSTVGYSWNLAGNYTFDDSGATTFESIGDVGSTFNLPSGTYAPENALSAFNGGNAAGTWTLSISDNAGLDIGSIGGWTLSVTTVPAPTSMALLGLGGLVAGRRRR